jgi:hypothetical protein
MPHKCTIQRRTRTKGSLSGSKDDPTVEQTDVPCWEQAASHAEIDDFNKQGMSVDRKIYFTSDPAVRRRHQILITERNGATVSSPIPLDVVSESVPDAGAGTGVVFKVMCDYNPARAD